ncbi:MAG: type II toxin-antitoxin system RelE/ParE family toxin [Verrucomicrobia bacterium]|nr:type II toxin-antitoxin system RelE/ParE family toxin [Verrucomicrobiota bacterium]
MRFKLKDIPGLDAAHQNRWRIKSLEIDGKNPVLAELAGWSSNAKADFNKIMKVMRYVGTQDRVRNKKHVKKSDNPKHGDVYEMRADKGSARLMFFYSERDRSVVVCTNTYWKAKDSKKEQDVAFDLCGHLKRLYEREAGNERKRR